MKKTGWVAVSAALLIMAGCKTVPKPVPTPSPVPTPAATNIAPSPDASAIARAEALAAEAQALRAKIIELGYNEKDPGSWAEANDAWTQAGVDRDAGSLDAANAGYRKAVDLYGAMLSKGMQSDIETAREAAMKARDAAEPLGARQDSAAIWASASAAFAAGDLALGTATTEKPLSFEAPLTAFRKAAAEWSIALDRGKAARLKAGIDARGFAVADPGNYELAGQKYDESASAFDSGDAKASAGHAQESLLRYTQVWDKAWALALGERRVLVDESRRLAEEAKAARAVPDDWKAAVAVYEDAEALQASGDYERSESRWDEASGLFQEARVKTEEKRVTAERALQSLDARIRSSSGAVESGDSVLNGAAPQGAPR